MNNVWQDWLNSKVSTGSVPGLPEYAQEVLRVHGLPDHTKPCKGCIHLRKTRKTGKILTCTAHGEGREWNPLWPACGDLETKAIMSAKATPEAAATEGQAPLP